MRRFRPLALPIVVAALLAGAPAATAKPCDDHNTVPPGNSEVDQYSETVPGHCGNENVPSPDPEGNDSLESIPPATLAQLESLGPDGRAAALLAAAGLRGRGSEGGAGGGANGSAAGQSIDSPLGAPGILDSADDDGSAFGSLLDALSGNGGLGIILPLTLALVVALAVLAVLRARRSAP